MGKGVVCTRSCIEIYGRVALTGQSEKFEIDLNPLSLMVIHRCISCRKEIFTAIFENITERKQAEEALRESAAELARAQQNLPYWQLNLRTLLPMS